MNFYHKIQQKYSKILNYTNILNINTKGIIELDSN